MMIFWSKNAQKMTEKTKNWIFLENDGELGEKCPRPFLSTFEAQITQNRSHGQNRHVAPDTRYFFVKKCSKKGQKIEKIDFSRK